MSKVVQICGASGSGKSYIAHYIRRESINEVPLMIDGRSKPLGYHLNYNSNGNRLFLAGSYETVTGGIDNIPTQDLIYDTIKAQWDAGCDILFEGLFGRNFTRATDLLRKVKDPSLYHIIFLTTTLADCIASIDARRAARGIERKQLSTKPGGTVEDAIRTHSSYTAKMKALGVNAYRLDRAAAMAKVKELLGG